ncbi:MAG: hypothetical protein FHP92_17680 [Denitromonas halophila]|nr:MAG: hypothetical protein FHP94_09335 [Denitromonas halophila]TVT70557.1 MAG: hypothetical protein FHP92_17680 [Denitromonas halophila]TVT75679.1 MAG: hypothetical protein FHP93_00305 [Denitromonas halophila]
MQMRPEVQIAAMIKALTDVVIPAVPPSNKLAAEQAQLVVGMLHLMAAQLPVQFRFDRDELGRLLEAASELSSLAVADEAPRAALAELDRQRTEAMAVLEACRGEPAQLQASVASLRTSMCSLVDSFAASEDVVSRERVETALFAMSKAQLLRDRALMKPQRWEPDPAAVPDITSLLAG